MSISAATICSNALMMLGDNAIASLTEDSDRARLANALWEPVRDMVLRGHPWNCAVKRVSLGPDATAPAFDYTHAFTLPSDWLRTLSVGEEGERPEYRIESGKVLMRQNVCLLRYIWRNDQPATWDSMLVWAMTSCMRSVFAYGITQSTSLEQLVEQVLRDVLRQARAVDGVEEPPQAMDDSPLVSARFLGRGLGMR